MQPAKLKKAISRYVDFFSILALCSFFFVPITLIHLIVNLGSPDLNVPMKYVYGNGVVFAFSLSNIILYLIFKKRIDKGLNKSNVTTD